ncbi:GntR family transcriptional regulator [Kitasatospora sp. LaBMicrA B282]|uniref:GntR family transcriptional regulator n=1 Tax=Kitasatospora sp. LaBMicrA B282 TaxID=3420949 RepID=UPI003D0ECBBF
MASYRSGTPRYLRIAWRLQERIDAGEFPPGARLPSEPELCAEFEVNRLTIRQAVAELERAAAVEIRRGVGTFVRRPPIRLSVAVDPRRQQLDLGSVQHARPVGSTDHPGERIVAVQPGDTGLWGREAAQHLGREAAELTRIETLIPVGATDAAVSSYWLPTGLLPNELLAGELPAAGTAATGEAGNLLVAFTRATGIRLEYDWRAFSAVAADLVDAELLGVPVGAPLLVREGVSGRADGEPVLYVRRRIKGDAMRFVLRYRDHNG